MQILNDLKENREYCKLKEEGLDRKLWRISFERCYGPFVRQIMQKHSFSTLVVDRNSSVGMATRYGLDGSEIESR